MPLRFSEILLLPNSALLFRCNLKLVPQAQFGSFGLLTPRFNLYRSIYKKLYRLRGSHTSLPAPKSQCSVKKAQLAQHSLQSCEFLPPAICKQHASNTCSSFSSSFNFKSYCRLILLFKQAFLHSVALSVWSQRAMWHISCSSSHQHPFSSITQLSFPRHVPPLRSTPVTRSHPSLS
jgi:hypothetical protein